MYTVTKSKRDVGPQHVGDGKFPHPHTVDRSKKSVINKDRAAQALWTTGFSVPHMFLACVTLDFFLTVL
jgi:hypothetical protein